MSEPRLRRRNHGKGHSYLLDDKKIDGVTTILNSLPKIALIDWAARTTAAAAVDRWDELAQMPLSKRLRELEQARWNAVKTAGLRGTTIHALADRLAHGLPVDVPDEHVGPVEAYARFLDKWDIHMIATEAPCANTELNYGGTLDAVGTIGRLGTGPVMIDLKTGGVYDEAALQVAAYAGCDLWQPDGPESEQAMPELEGLYIARILTDDVLLLPVVDEPDRLLLQFRYVMATHRWLARVKDDPAIGAALDPAEFHRAVAG
jgi:hypothetical protein